MSDNKKLLITVTAISSSVMEVLDMTIVNVALPDMQGALAATPDQISWVLTSYMVATAIFVPLTGFLSEKFGLKNYFIFCIIGFTIASALCGTATNLEMMVIARILQGTFGAGLLPLSQTIMYHAYPKEELGKAMTIWTMGIIIGPVVGPTLGGFIIDQLNWRWIFFINVPTGIFASIIAWRVLEKTPSKNIYVDWTGILLLALGVGCFQLVLDRGNTEDWFESSIIWYSSIISVFGICAFIYHSLFQSPEPIVKLQIFKDRNFAISCILMLFVGLGLFGTLILQPLMMTLVYSYPALEIGITMMPRAVASFITMIFISRLINKVPARTLVTLGLLFVIISAAIAGATLNPQSSNFWLIFPFIFQGMGLGCIFAPLGLQSIATMPKELVHQSNAIFNLMRVLGGSIGIAIIVTYFTRNSDKHWQESVTHLNPYNPAVNKYLENLDITYVDPISGPILAKELLLQAQMQGFVNSFYLMAIIFICIIPLAFLLNKHVIGHKADATEEAITEPL
jgi:MFS transporter, DHA2 family, multidrug resistance protein